MAEVYFFLQEVKVYFRWKPSIWVGWGWWKNGSK